MRLDATEFVVVESGAGHPRVRRHSCRVVGDGGVHLVHRPGLGQVELGEGEAEPRGVTVGVVEARDEGGAARVQDTARGQVFDVVVESRDPAVQDSQGAGGGPVVVEGEDARVAHQQVEEHGVGPSLRRSGAVGRGAVR